MECHEIIRLPHPRYAGGGPVYKREDLQVLRRWAEALRLGEHLPQKACFGICHNLTALSTAAAGRRVDAYDLLELISWKWPLARTYDVDGMAFPHEYFVPHVSGFGLWEGPNLECRQDLLGFVVQYLDDVLAQ